MSQTAKAQEPTMEEILASIRRIIADDETSKVPPPRPAPPHPPPAPPHGAMPSRNPRPPAPPLPPSMNQDDVDAMLSGLDAPPGGGHDEHGSDDVLELTESMAASQDHLTNFQTIDGQPDVVFTDAPANPEPTPRMSEEPQRPAALNGAPDRPLLSNTAAAAVDSAFNTLAQTVLVQNARTLEDLVKEMLRPLLKSWLDDNLPGLVERIVKAEIERVSRGRG